MRRLWLLVHQRPLWHRCRCGLGENALGVHHVVLEEGLDFGDERALARRRDGDAEHLGQRLDHLRFA